MKHSFILDGAKILGEYWDGNTLIPLYDNEDNVCGILHNDIPYYFLKNLQGDVIAITNQRGETVARYTYDAWGACTISYDATATPTVEGGEAINIATVNPFRYRSYYFDTETGLYYLQSRYYDPTLGRFLNFDSVAFLGCGGILSYNICIYCENNIINYVDYYGHAPSLSTLTQMHNAVLRSAQAFLFSLGILTNSEVMTCNTRGVYNGRMDIYSFVSNQVWEVKRRNQYGINKGLSQLGKYTTSYVYSLYHSFVRLRKTPQFGKHSVYGAVVVSGYLVIYSSSTINSALILYDYMTLERASKLLFAALTATAAYWGKLLKKYSQKVKTKVFYAVSLLENLFEHLGAFMKGFVDFVANFLKTATPGILILVVVILLVYLGINFFV